MREKGIPFLPSLPPIEPEDETELRTSEEVGIRMFCLFCVAGTAYGLSRTEYELFLKNQRLWSYLTPKETAFLSDPNPAPESMRYFTWRVEALFLLMWAVNLFESLHLPTYQMDNEKIIDKFPTFSMSPWPFINSLVLRPKSEILDQSDLIYRLHWAARNAIADEQPPPAGLEPDVLFEWHHAINWLTKYENLDWDDVVTDT